MDKVSSAIEEVITEALKPGTPGILVFESYWCPVSIISITEKHIRISRPVVVDRMYVGARVHLELCSSRGCLIIDTEVLEVPEVAIEGIVLAYPKELNKIFLRRFWRILVNIPVILKPHAHPINLRGIILNISAGGMLVEIPRTELNISDAVDIFLTLPGFDTFAPIEMQLVGSVTHISLEEEKLKVSLKFIGMFPDDEKKINDYVIATLRKSCPTLQI